MGLSEREAKAWRELISNRRQETAHAAVKTPKRSKYRNVRTEVDGIVFASKREADRYRTLKLWERAGIISELRLQVPFKVCDACVFEDGKKARQRPYIADFVYVKDGVQVVEDAKGMRTEMYKFKKQLMKVIFNIDIQEV